MAQADPLIHKFCASLHPESMYQPDEHVVPKPKTYSSRPTDCLDTEDAVHLTCPNQATGGFLSPDWVCMPQTKPPAPAAPSTAVADPQADAIRSCLVSLEPRRASADGSILIPTSRVSTQSTPLYDENGDPLMDDRTDTQATKITKVKQPGVYSITSDGKIYFSACSGKGAFRKVVYPDPITGMPGNTVTLQNEDLSATYKIADAGRTWSVVSDPKKVAAVAKPDVCQSERAESTESRAYFESVVNFDLKTPDATDRILNDDGSVAHGGRPYWIKRLDILNACRSRLTPFAAKIDSKLLPLIGVQAAAIIKTLGLDSTSPSGKTGTAGSAESPR